METGPFTGHQRMSDAWFAFRDFVRDNEDVPVGMLVRGGCKNDPGDEVIAAYDAPYIDAASKAGARAFPLILPTTPEAVGAVEGKRVADGLREDDRPSLVLWADSDPILPFSVGERVSSELNLPPPRPIADASHFLQEDAGPEIGAIIAEWLRLTQLGAISSIMSACERSSSSWTRRGGPVVLDPGDGPRPVGAGRGAGVVEGGGEDPAAGVVELAAAGQRPLGFALAAGRRGGCGR